MPARKKEGGISPAVFSFSAVYHFVYCILVSDTLFQRPLIGGAFYLTGRILLQLAAMRRPPRSEVVTKAQKIAGYLLLGLMFVLAVAVTAMEQVPLTDGRFWMLAIVALLLAVRTGVMEFLIERDVIRGADAGKVSVSGLAAEGLLALLPAFGFFFVCRPAQAWALIGGIAVGCVMDWVEFSDDRVRMLAHGRLDENELKDLSGANAYRQYQTITMCVTAATQVTMAITYAYLGLAADTVLYCMLTAFGTMILSIVLVDLTMRKNARRLRDPGNILMIGAAVWLYGVLLFIRNFSVMSLPEAYLSLGLCSFGCAVCARALSYLDRVMRKVASFTLNAEIPDVYDWNLRVRMEVSAVLGQFLALTAIVLLEIFAKGTMPDNLPELLQRFSPLMTVPAFAMVAAVLFTSLRFPMTARHIEKLDRYLHMRREGVENRALRDQLQSVIIGKSLRHYGIAILKMLLRPIYRHRVLGKENVRLDEDTSCVFICNHGELYGPIVTELYVPYPFRPWATYEITDSQMVADYLYETKFRFQKWIPAPLRKPLCDKIIGPVLAWIMREADTIPVYHGDAHQLMNTFRETVKAMEAGDNILLFPENSATSETGKFVREGVSEFFTGFTMIGQLYHRKTGKCCQFIPVYANQKSRTVRFGQSVRYDPDNKPNDEKERIVSYLREELLRMSKETGRK